MAMVAVGTGSVILFVEFRAEVERTRVQLSDVVQAQARLVEGITRDRQALPSIGAGTDPLLHAISLLTEAQKSFRFFGETGEFTFAELRGDSIYFLIQLRDTGPGVTQTIPANTTFAAPMRKALEGGSGTLDGLDFWGIRVLAGYEPVHVEGYTLGLVAKVDRAEIVRPLMEDGAKAAIVALILIGLGALLIQKVGNPFVRSLEEDERRYRLLFEESPIAIMETDFSDVRAHIDELRLPSMEDPRSYLEEHPEELEKLVSLVKILSANRAGRRLWGAKSEDQFSPSLQRHLTQESLPVFREEMVVLAAGGTLFESEIQVRKVLDGPKTLLMTIGIFPGCEESWSRVLVSFIDITMRKEAERALELSRERLRGLSARLTRVREEERASVSRDLHDELGQNLTALRMDLAVERSVLPEVDILRRMTFDRLIRTTDESIEWVQSLSGRLRPPVLDVLGLGAAIHWYVDENRQRADSHFSLDLPDLPQRLPEHQEISLFRILQEALTNVFRHAKAENVWISLREQSRAVILRIEDDGLGLPPGALEALSSQGLLGMQERAVGMRGQLTLAAREGGGTVVQVRIPVSATGGRARKGAESVSDGVGT